MLNMDETKARKKYRTVVPSWSHVMIALVVICISFVYFFIAASPLPWFITFMTLTSILPLNTSGPLSSAVNRLLT